MKFDVQLPDLSDARFQRDVGASRMTAAAALLTSTAIFCLTLTRRGEEGAFAFGASYLVIPAVLALGMLLERRFRVTKLIQASILVALAKFLLTMTIHLAYKRLGGG